MAHGEGAVPKNRAKGQHFPSWCVYTNMRIAPSNAPRTSVEDNVDERVMSLSQKE